MHNERVTAMNERISKLRQESLDATPRLCIERAR